VKDRRIVLTAIAGKRTVFWVPFGRQPASAGFLLSLLSDPKDGGDIFHRNIRLTPDNLTLELMKPHSLLNLLLILSAYIIAFSAFYTQFHSTALCSQDKEIYSDKCKPHFHTDLDLYLLQSSEILDFDHAM
jgi:hypothetical protein